jgi:hypothetical protein
MSRERRGLSRRTVLRSTGALGAGSAAAGCSARTDGGEPTDAIDGVGTPSAAVEAPGSASALQSTIDQLASETADGSFAVIEGRHDTVYEVAETIEIPTNVFLRNFQFKMADGAETTVLKSKGFDDLVGTNTWSAKGGVPYNFGLINVHVDGNKSNNGGRPEWQEGDGRWDRADPQKPKGQRSGRGIALYAKRYYLDNVLVRDCPRVGFYSECAAKGGQPAGWPDLPEGQIGRLWVRNCDDDALVFRGPHDGQAESLITAVNAGRGIRVESDYGDEENGYSGNGFIVSKLHTYSNGGRQLFDSPGFEAYWNYIDNEPGCDVHSPVGMHSVKCASGWMGPNDIVLDAGATIHSLHMSGQDDDSETDGLTINDGSVHVGHVDVGDYPGSGIVVNDNGVVLENVSSSRNGDYGVKLIGQPDRDGVFGSDVTITEMNKNETAGFYYRGGKRNDVTLNAYISADFTGYDTSGALPGPLDDFDVRINQGGGGFYRSEHTGRTRVEGDGSTRTFSVGHELLGAPRSAMAVAASESAPAIARTSNYTADSFDVTFREAPASGSSPAVSFFASL